MDALELAEQPIGRLSGGERQRLLIAQALVTDPRLLLLDEPLANLDIAREQEIIALVRRICRSRGVAVLFVTHDINPLLRDVDRVLYLAGGRSAIGTPTRGHHAGMPQRTVRVTGRGGRRRWTGSSSWERRSDMLECSSLPFIVHALLTASIAAVVAAVSGYFLVSRGLTFAGHALPNIGFAGAAGAVLLGIEPVLGLFAFTLGAGVVVGFVGEDLRERDVSIGVVMTFALGLGLLFLACTRATRSGCTGFSSATSSGSAHALSLSPRLPVG